ncbi:splicing factor ESS-2 homolog [Aplysia californica]|uniref:Splicing factor ESS-2 homolog n=1 Tax=Aplysia californica TaxID=6500 RepID=A0ABM0JV24_APLCA|nr:splicing factor ESS-2 homolog [Aplysia californica]
MADKIVVKKDQALVPFQFKVPAQRAVKAQKVLTEDEFSQGITKIIERDFFPDIPKLEAQVEYYEALEKNDLVKLREIQMQYGRPETGASGAALTPATFETPVGRRKTTPAKKGRPSTDNLRPGTSGDVGGTSEDVSEEVPEEEMETPKMKLDSFLARNTSEDSASFSELLKESERKRQLKYEWLFQKEKEQLAEHEDFAALPSIEEQAAIEDKPLHVNTWKYVNENHVMYVPEGMELSAKEQIEDKKHKPKQIIHENTRFQHAPFNTTKSKEAMQQAASFKALINKGKIGHDGKEMLQSQSPQVNGYGFMRTPSPAPGVADSPMMTWGEIESTPARLDNANDLLPAATPGPVFRIPDVPKRERLALELSERASKAHRAKKEEALRQVTRRFASPSPSSKISLSSVERLNSMSPAAQRLASKRLGIRVSTDKALQASYSPSPSPSHRVPGTKTPVRLTPSSKRSARSSLPGTPGLRTPSSERGNGTPTPTSETTQEAPSLTDHLLNLPKRKRKSAADFF